MSAQLLDASMLDGLIRAQLPAAADGDRAAYSRIVAACQNTVTCVALAIVRDVHASEDIAQEAFLSAWQNLRRLQNPASFLPWLRQITRNLALDHLRSGRRAPDAVDDAEAAIAAAADPHPTPDEHLIEHEQQRMAAELISALPDDSREVLLLYYREGQSSQQVAVLLGLSDAAVRKRLSRARATVRSELLARFGAFARDTAPSVAFTAMVATALGVASPPAAAAVAITAGSIGTTLGVAGKLGSGLGGVGKFGGGAGVAALPGGVAGGSLGLIAELQFHADAMLGAVIGGMLGAFFAAWLLLRMAGSDVERRALTRFVWVSSLTAGAACLVLMLTMLLSRGWLLPLSMTVVVLGLMNYQYLVVLHRLLAPYRARRLALHGRMPAMFEWTFGRAGCVLSTGLALAAMVFALYRAGRF